MLAKKLTAATLVLATSAAALGAYALQDELQMPQPTEQHRELLMGVGTWKGTLTMNIPGVPAEPVAATEVVTAVGEFWTSSEFRCELMGMPYHGTGVVGYDPDREKYVGTWVDNSSSFLSVMEGEAQEDGTIVMRWEAPSMTGEGLVPHRNELVYTGDAYTSQFFVGEGEGMKIMTIEMKRAAGDDGAHDGH